MTTASTEQLRVLGQICRQLAGTLASETEETVTNTSSSRYACQTFSYRSRVRVSEPQIEKNVRDHSSSSQEHLMLY
jgi:hypothetical protein